MAIKRPRRTNEARERALNPHRDEQLRAAMGDTRTRLEHRGIVLTGTETPAELADLDTAVERFEREVRARGGDLYVDEPPSTQPDRQEFALPRRAERETVREYICRIDERAAAVKRTSR